MKRNFKGSFLSLTPLNLPEKKKKKSELDSKLVLGDDKLMNCRHVTKDLAQNSGYQADRFLLVALLWALCNCSLLLWLQRALYEADECLRTKIKQKQRLSGVFLPIPLSFCPSQKKQESRIQVKTKQCIILKCNR